MTRSVTTILLRGLRLSACCASLVAGSAVWSVGAETAGYLDQRDASSTPPSAQAGLAYLKSVMDEFHTRFPVYDDVSSPGNHFHAYTKIPDENAAVDLNGSSTASPHSGATATRCEFRSTTGLNFGGLYFQNGILPAGATAPQFNFGTEPNAGIDLSGATGLSFWGRGERGGERVEFFMGGVGRDPATGAPLDPCTPDVPGPCPYPDSTPVVKIAVTLTTEWTRFVIDLSGEDLTYVLGGFGWVANAPNNPTGAVFYLDDIQYELGSTRLAARLNEPRFLRSFSTLPLQPDPFDANTDDDIDLVLRNSAFTYDNALALLAFLADGSADSLRRAKLIGDAFVYASTHDRTYDDGRLRSDYSAGDISLPPGWTPNGRVGTVPIPGFYDEATQQFYEVEQQAVDSGNNAWTMIALLALYERTRETAYFETARRLAEFIHSFRSDTGRYRGFLGGIIDPESATPTNRIYASTEHNLDVIAAFGRMYQITRDRRWAHDADHARTFVRAMWDGAMRCFLAGTIDPDTRNTNAGQLPLDVQAWSVLSVPGTIGLRRRALTCAAVNHRTTDNGFTGYDFNEDKDGVWFEGTGQMAVADAFAGRIRQAAELRDELARVQNTAPFGDGHGLAAASHDGLTTGFAFKYFRRLHVGATTWNIFAQLGFNPFYQTRAKRWPPTRLLRYPDPDPDVGEPREEEPIVQCAYGREGTASQPGP
jgi:hypothetical protein